MPVVAVVVNTIFSAAKKKSKRIFLKKKKPCSTCLHMFECLCCRGEREIHHRCNSRLPQVTEFVNFLFDDISFFSFFVLKIYSRRDGHYLSTNLQKRYARVFFFFSIFPCHFRGKCDSERNHSSLSLSVH